MKNKRKLIIVISLLALVLLAGFKISAVELKGLDNGKRLVYLDEVLSRGGSYIALTDEGDGDTEEETPVINKTDESAKNTLTIRVSDKRLYLQDKFISSDVSVFIKRFSDQYDASKSVVLTDDYARYKSFKDLMAYLDGEGIGYTIKTE